MNRSQEKVRKQQRTREAIVNGTEDRNKGCISPSALSAFFVNERRGQAENDDWKGGVVRKDDKQWSCKGILIVLLKYNSHTIQFHPFICPIFFCILTDLCNHQHNYYGTFSSPHTENHDHLTFFHLQFWANTNLLSVSINLSIWDGSHKWNYTICGLTLASLT